MRRLYPVIAQASVLFTLVYFVLAAALIRLPFGSFPEWAQLTTLFSIPNVVAFAWIYRGLHSSHKAEAATCAALFVGCTPVSLLISVLLGAFFGGYADVFVRGHLGIFAIIAISVETAAVVFIIAVIPAGLLFKTRLP